MSDEKNPVDPSGQLDDTLAGLHIKIFQDALACCPSLDPKLPLLNLRHSLAAAMLYLARIYQFVDKNPNPEAAPDFGWIICFHLDRLEAALQRAKHEPPKQKPMN